MRARTLRWRSSRRRPWVFWMATTVVASVTGLLVASLVAEGERRLEAWGPGRNVPIATRDLAPGSVVADNDVRWELRPNAVVTNQVFEPEVRLPGRVVVSPVFEGEAFVRNRLAPEGVEGLNALVPAGAAAIVIPASTPAPKVRVGDTVDLFAGSNPVELGGGAGEALTRGATVIETADDGAITIAVRRDDLPRITPAILDGAVVVALVPRT